MAKSTICWVYAHFIPHYVDIGIEKWFICAYCLERQGDCQLTGRMITALEIQQMGKSSSHSRAQGRAAGRTGRTEVRIRGNQRLDAQRGRTATEVERSGNKGLLAKAARRLKDSGCKQKILQVPQKDMTKAVQAMQEKSVKGTVKNMSGTKRRSV